MSRYINRLVRCGYTRAKAKRLCIDFIKNLSIFDLEQFVLAMEESHGIQILQPEPC